MSSVPTIPYFGAGNKVTISSIQDATLKGAFTKFATELNIATDTFSINYEDAAVSAWMEQNKGLVGEVNKLATKLRTESMSSSAPSGAEIKTSHAITADQFKAWQASEGQRISPELLKYLRDTSDVFEGVNISQVDYSNEKSRSLNHRKMMTYLISKFGLERAVRMVEEKIIVPGDNVANAAVVAIPKSKIEFILCERAMRNNEGVFAGFLWALWESKCAYSKALEAHVPDFIGGGSKDEIARGISITPELKAQRRTAFTRSMCSYMQSLFNSKAFAVFIGKGQS